LKVTAIAGPGLLISSAIDAQVSGAVTAALQSVRTSETDFIVNDSLWFAENDRGKVTPCVMNSATFISKKILGHLESLGWTKEKVLIEQRIDAYVELPAVGQAYRVPGERFLEFFSSFLATPEGAIALSEAGALDRLFTKLYGTLVSRPFVHPEGLPSHLQAYAVPSSDPLIVRIGLEFETGNIASSFRALYKLGFLYSEGEIDAGVFITSVDKASCACRIWPISNRNGSFQELKQRNYRRMVVLPLWEFGFAPDGFSTTASFLGSDGGLFVPSPTSVTFNAKDGSKYDVFTGERGKKVLRPQ
jgi:hypothetical protein